MPRYSVYVLPHAVHEIDHLPGHIRSRVRQAILGFEQDAQPGQSKRLSYDLQPGHDLYRLRLGAWRVIYLLDGHAARIYVLAVRRRPPYVYGDLDDLVSQVE